MTAPIVAHSFDPYHGDPNNRFPRLGAPVKRVVAREQWYSPLLFLPAFSRSAVDLTGHHVTAGYSADVAEAYLFAFVPDDGWTPYSEAA